ncbi:hypothetical protein M0804_000864 [Polistes exclamans]|nr:hypothetical protein M0804_000864 [Polistes exclamans]
MKRKLENCFLMEINIPFIYGCLLRLDSGGVIYRRVAQLFDILDSFWCSKPDQPLCRTDWLNGSQLVDLPLPLPPYPVDFVKTQGIPSETLSSSKSHQSGDNFNLMLV